jgi:histidinol dehydrogenase
VRRAAFEVPRKRIKRAVDTLDPALLEALQLAAGEIERFHRKQTRNSWVDFGVEGALGQLVVPLRRVGLYAPGGSAPLPSSLLMAAIPARVAGVEEIIVCSPPQRAGGEIADVVLAAAHVAGVERVFALGGAQAIAAMAYGTESVPQVDKIAGPGPICWLRPSMCWLRPSCSRPAARWPGRYRPRSRGRSRRWSGPRTPLRRSSSAAVS